jgi:hypothetical protein
MRCKPPKRHRPCLWCDKCQARTAHYFYPREGTTPVTPCVFCKSVYMAKRYRADPERYKKAARRHRDAPHP